MASARIVVATILLAGLAACSGADGVELSAAAAEGRELATQFGCTSCHATEGTDEQVGPSWVGVWGTDVPIEGGGPVTFDADYVHESVRDPDAVRRDGDWVRMPVYVEAQISDDEIASIARYIEELGE